ncbi:TerC/Alx family metal homeostasis membrane protein [Marinilongibacter aquaticus]|uniref:TerC/Alx family metal homeostasis membrane protein n=1 Tax=Marinilongibacter aquaticus TaxID=2975157 RepID=UPI0021BD697E|nr:TerC/Alx family metal homeostasis membrane protein [Marinilongibacter aquaticus]UBM57988.1 TerC/Alx family metal homeostasis membrane protein [Marinilongibacter aquaticus]
MEISNELLFFGGFAIFVIFVMLLDLGAFSKSESHVVKFKEAAFWSAVWVALAVVFYFFLKNYAYLIHDISTPEALNKVASKYHKGLKLPEAFEDARIVLQKNMALEYLTGYLVEYSLSVDNIFVFILIFTSFGVREKFYKKVLVWGILGSIILRFIFIFLGAALIQRFDWILYIFGAFLVYTGIKILLTDDEDEEIDTKNHPAVKFTSRYFNVYEKYVSDHFLIRHRYRGNKMYVTPLFVVIVVIAFTDVIFAVDSIPAIFSITKDPYIVFFSNVFAIMGLRSMFFFLVNIINMFAYLKYGLGVLLSFIGLKMLGHHWLSEWGFTNQHSLMVIVGILAISIILSWLFPPKEEKAS